MKEKNKIHLFLIYSLLIILITISITALTIAQDYKISISTSKETFNAGENITLKVTLYDSNNNPIKDKVLVILEDAEKNIKIEKQIPSNEFVDISLNSNNQKVSYGQGKIIAKYKDSTTENFFIIEIQELAKFELDKDNLIITNIGNTRYSKTIQILIGNTLGTKNPKLNIGKSIKYKLIAPEGVYNIKVTDGKTTLKREEIKLTGTGNVIGALDETKNQIGGITGGISPNENQDFALLNYAKKSKFIYTFILVIFGAMVLLAIEKNFRKKINS